MAWRAKHPKGFTLFVDLQACWAGDTAPMSSLLVSDGDCWQIRADAHLAWRLWDGEYVVHHALSNDTFRLSEAAGRLLVFLFDCDAPRTVPTLAAACQMDGSDLQSVLEQLAQLGFVVQC